MLLQRMIGTEPHQGVAGHNWTHKAHEETTNHIGWEIREQGAAGLTGLPIRGDADPIAESR